LGYEGNSAGHSPQPEYKTPNEINVFWLAFCSFMEPLENRTRTKHGQAKFPGLEPDDLARACVAMRERSHGFQEHAAAANSKPDSAATWLLVALGVWKQARSRRPI